MKHKLIALMTAFTAFFCAFPFSVLAAEASKGFSIQYKSPTTIACAAIAVVGVIIVLIFRRKR